MVCSQCCGETRGAATCNGCSFLADRALAKNYRSVPYFETSALSRSTTLENIANVIESTLCAFDVQGEKRFTDKEAIRLIELLLDEHHFKDPQPTIEQTEIASMHAKMRQTLARDLQSVNGEDLVKVLASIYRSIQRRTNGDKAYLNFIRQYVGPGVYSRTQALSMSG